MSGAAVKAVKRVFWASTIRGSRGRKRVPLVAGALAAAMVAVVPSAAQAAGATRYVDSASAACSDTGTGTQAQPYCTLGKGVSAMGAGNTLIVMPGNYTGGVTIGASYAGTSAQPTTIRSATPRGAVINASATAGITVSKTSYVVVDGFKIDGTTKEGIGVYSSSNVTIRGNEVSHAGVGLQGKIANGIELSGTTSSTVSGNYLHDNSNDGIALLSSAGTAPQKSSGNTVSGNTSTHNARGYLRSATGILVNGDNNRITGNTTNNNEDTGIQVSAAGATGAPASGNSVVSNLAYGNGDHGIDLSQGPNTSILGNSVYQNATAGIDAESNSSGLTVVNNISADNAIDGPRTRGQIRVDTGSQTGTVVNSNVVYNSAGQPLYTWGTTQYSSMTAFRSASGQAASDLSGNPKWVNAAAGDFHLLSGSPAIDNADTSVLGWPACDKENVCPHNDRGALEFVPAAASAPAAPSGVTAQVAGVGSAYVSWTAPNNGGSSITGYTITASPAAGTPLTVAGSSTSGTVTGLANGTKYTFTVKATNIIGTGPASSPSNSITTPDKPKSPTGVTAQAGVGTALVSWTAPDNGGSAITGYTITPSSGVATLQVAGSATSGTITGLANGTSYTFTVKATNAVGTGPASQSSNSVMPGSPRFTAVSPRRVLDTRTGTGAARAKLGSGASLTLTIPGLPASTTAVTLNVTATNPTAASYLAVYPAGQTRSSSSNLNFTAGVTIPNLVTVAVGPNNTVTIYNYRGTVDVVADLAGYYAAGSGSGLTAVSPKRVLDTRTGTGAARAKLGSGASLTLTIPGLPASTTAVTLNVTATNPTAASYLAVYPAGQTRSSSSNLNFTAGVTIPNLVTVAVGPNNTVTIYNNRGTVDVVADLAGYFGS